MFLAVLLPPVSPSHADDHGGIDDRGCHDGCALDGHGNDLDGGHDHALS